MIIHKKARVSAAQAKRLTVQFEDGQHFEVMVDDGFNYKPDDELMVSIAPQSEAVLGQQALAREILNQLLAEEK